MPPASLAGAYAKVDWANKRFAELDGLSETLAEKNNHLIRHEDNPNTKERSYRLIGDPVIPVEYSLIAGEVIQHLRSALDHLAFALCAGGAGGLAAIGKDQLRAIQFPISGGNASDHRNLPAARVIAALAKPGAIDEINRAEPYKGGAGDALHRLSLLNNTDKHRLLLTCGFPPPAIEMGEGFLEALGRVHPDLLKNISSDTPPLIVRPQIMGAHLKAGDVFFRTTMSGELDKHLDVSFTVALYEPGVSDIKPLSELMNEFFVAVRSLIPKFEPYV